MLDNGKYTVGLSALGYFEYRNFYRKNTLGNRKHSPVFKVLDMFAVTSDNS